MIIYDVDPAVEELAFLFVALYGLRSGNDRHPLLNILLCGIALFAEQLKISVGTGNVAVEPEQKICPCGIG